MTIKDIYDFLSLTPDQLMETCKTSNYQASGPGGQKRNRKLSAVRLIHIPSGLSTTAAEFREPNRNLGRALQKLRLEIALNLPLEEINQLNETNGANGTQPGIPHSPFRIDANENHPDFPPSALAAYHRFYINEGGIGETAKQLNTSSAALIRFFKKNKNLWQKIQNIRKQFDLYPLK